MITIDLFIRTTTTEVIALVIDGELADALNEVKSHVSQAVETITDVPYMPKGFALSHMVAAEEGGDKECFIVHKLYYLNEGRPMQDVVAPMRVLIL